MSVRPPVNRLIPSAGPHIDACPAYCPLMYALVIPNSYIVVLRLMLLLCFEILYQLLSISCLEHNVIKSIPFTQIGQRLNKITTKWLVLFCLMQCSIRCCFFSLLLCREDMSLCSTIAHCDVTSGKAPVCVWGEKMVAATTTRAASGTTSATTMTDGSLGQTTTSSVTTRTDQGTPSFPSTPYNTKFNISTVTTAPGTGVFDSSSPQHVITTTTTETSQSLGPQAESTDSSRSMVTRALTPASSAAPNGSPVTADHNSDTLNQSETDR